EWIAENEEVEIPIMMYELKLFNKGGFAPTVDHCINCGESATNYSFSIREGGLLCNRCDHMDDHAIKLPETLAKLFHLFLQVGLERIGTISVSEKNKALLRKIIDAYYDQYGSYTLKTRKFLKQ